MKNKKWLFVLEVYENSTLPTLHQFVSRTSNSTGIIDYRLRTGLGVVRINKNPLQFFTRALNNINLK